MNPLKLSMVSVGMFLRMSERRAGLRLAVRRTVARRLQSVLTMRSIGKSSFAKPRLKNAVRSATEAGLRYTGDDQPGIRRLQSGSGFRYVNTRGKQIRDARTLARIESLAIPPAWTEVWICPSSKGHIQATGRDARRRKQFRYHPAWCKVRDEAKYRRLARFAEALPRIRARVAKDLRRRGLPRRKVLAAMVRVLESTLMRIGNPEYARTNNSFGLTTLRDHHATIRQTSVEFVFRGKGGVRHAVTLTDRQLARIVNRCRDLTGRELFQYVDQGGRRRRILSTDLNQYLRMIAGVDVTAKDFRTWAATVLATKALRTRADVRSQAEAKRNVVRAVDEIADRLGNTRAVCRKSYVLPELIEAYLEGSLRQRLYGVNHRTTRLSSAEGALATFLKNGRQPG